MVSISCAWQQRVYSAAYHAFYCGYRFGWDIQEVDTAIENLWQALEKGQGVDTIMERINKRQEEIAELEAQLAIEAKKERVISAQEVRAGGLFHSSFSSSISSLISSHFSPPFTL